MGHLLYFVFSLIWCSNYNSILTAHTEWLMVRATQHGTPLLLELCFRLILLHTLSG